MQLGYDLKCLNIPAIINIRNVTESNSVGNRNELKKILFWIDCLEKIEHIRPAKL